ncbi:MAG TPA: hypothetical protein VMG98_08465 [Verrucomicrobiae bacterium]|nr:hypothetical protein [Verrucomicrobiae bacterium]
MNRDRLLARLTPSANAIERLARKETDPALAHAFEPLTPGPIAASLLLAAIVAAGIIAAPFRLFRHEDPDER